MRVEAPRASSGARALRLVGLALAGVLGVLVTLSALVALAVPAFRSSLIRELAASALVLLVLHLAGGAVATAVGAFRVSTRIRARRLAAQPGFESLAMLWLISTLTAYVHIRHRRIEQHRAWMLRSYALTLAAVTLRILLPRRGAVGSASVA